MRLEDLADNSRTDKNTTHSYLPLYQTLLASKKETARNVLEVGIFCGGSIKLWRDFFTNATVYGLDIMALKDVWDGIKNQDRIILHTSTDAYNEEFFNTLRHIKFDFMLDDGPHTLESMKQFIKLYSQLMTPDGLLIIEDIQAWDWIDTLKAEVPEDLKPFIKVYDLRQNKNRYDDIVFTIDKSQQSVQMKVYVVNLERRTDRRAKLEAQFAKFGYTGVFIPAFDAFHYWSIKDCVTRARGKPHTAWWRDWHGNGCDEHMKEFMKVCNNDYNLYMNCMPSRWWIAKIGCAETHRKAWELIANGEDEYAIVCEDDAEFIAPMTTTPTDPGTLWAIGRHYWADKQGQNGVEGYIVSKSLASKMLVDLDICNPERKYWHTTPSPDDGITQWIDAGGAKASVYPEKLLKVEFIPDLSLDSEVERHGGGLKQQKKSLVREQNVF